MESVSNSQFVLVVDDEPDVRELMSEFIIQAGFQVSSCHSGEAALTELERRPYDIVVSDIRMRGIDGLELLRRVREKWPETEFILVSGHASVEGAIEALRLGAYDILLKPVRLEKLQSCVRRCSERLAYARENRELRDYVDKLKELNVRKEKFVAVANHELRTPMAEAAGLVALLKRKAATLPPETAQLVAGVDLAFGRLKEVVREIGELATARSLVQWVKPHPVRLGSIAQEVRRALEECAGRREVSTRFNSTVEESREVIADGAKVARAVGALIQNAVKYTPDGRSVAVAVEEADGLVIFTVTDEGVGVPSGEEDKIFDLFYAAGSELSHHSSNHEFGGGGLGVGLPLAQTIARAHGGDVTFAPNPTGGAIFSLSLSTGFN